MSEWKKTNGKDACGYKVVQHVLVDPKVSAKVWSPYQGEVVFSFDTDDSPSISGTLYMSGLTEDQLLNHGKRIVTDLLLPEYSVRQTSKKVAQKSPTKGMGNSAHSLSARAATQKRDSYGRFA
jgi:hypothetical protein